MTTNITMIETKLRESIGASLPKILIAAAKGVYPLAFRTETFSPNQFRVELPIVSSQLAYTGNWQILSFVLMDPGHIVKLGAMAFPKVPRSDSPKKIISANGEILNTAVAKLGYLLGKLENTPDVAITPPLAMNFSGEGSVDIACRDSLFFKLAFEDVFMTFTATIQSAAN